MTIVGGAYELLTLAGSGGMGAVWRARQLSLGRTVAVKLLLSDAGDDEPRRAAARRLRDEARAAARVAHPDLVAVLDTGEDTVLGPFIVYELLDGGSLRDRLNRAELGWTAALEEVGRPLLDGLAALHDAGMVHRDVKPENIIAGADGRFRLGDFGLALFEGRQARTAEGAFVGTPGYLAPERIIGATVGAPSDVYAAAVVLVETATGRLPFRGGSVADMVREQAVRSPSPSALAGLGLPDGVAAVLASALIREPERRPGAAELLGRLATPVTSTPTEVLRRSTGLRRRGGTAPTVSSLVTPPAQPRRRPPLIPFLLLLGCLGVVLAARWPWSGAVVVPPVPSVPEQAYRDDPHLRGQAQAWVDQFEDMRKLLREERARKYGRISQDQTGMRAIEAYVRRGDDLLGQLESAGVDGTWSLATRVVAAMQAALVARFDEQLDMSMPDLHRSLRPAGSATRASVCTRAERLLAAISADFARGAVETPPELVAVWCQAVQFLLRAALSLPEKEAAVAETRRHLEQSLGSLAPVMGIMDLALGATESDEARVREASRVPALLRSLVPVLAARPGGGAAAARFELALVRNLISLVAAALRDGLPPSHLDAVVAESLGFVLALERRDGPSPELTAARLSRVVLLLDVAVAAADKILRDWRGGESVPPPGRREIMAARLILASGELMPLIRRWLDASVLPQPLTDEVGRYLSEVDERWRAVAKLAPSLNDPTVLGALPADAAGMGAWALACAEGARRELMDVESVSVDLAQLSDGRATTLEGRRLACLVLFRRALWGLVGVCVPDRGGDGHLVDLVSTAGDVLTIQDYLLREDGSLFGLGCPLVTAMVASPLATAVEALRRGEAPGARRERYALQAVAKFINRMALKGPAGGLEAWRPLLDPDPGRSPALAVGRVLLSLETRLPAHTAALLASSCELVLGWAEERSPTSVEEAELFVECLGHLLDGWAVLGVSGLSGADESLERLVDRSETLARRWREAPAVGDGERLRLQALVDLYRAALEVRRSTSQPPAVSPATAKRLEEIRDTPELSALAGRCRRLLVHEDVVRLRMRDPLTLEGLSR